VAAQRDAQVVAALLGDDALDGLRGRVTGVGRNQGGAARAAGTAGPAQLDDLHLGFAHPRLQPLGLALVALRLDLGGHLGVVGVFLAVGGFGDGLVLVLDLLLQAGVLFLALLQLVLHRLERELLAVAGLLDLFQRLRLGDGLILGLLDLGVLGV